MNPVSSHNVVLNSQIPDSPASPSIIENAIPTSSSTPTTNPPSPEYFEPSQAIVSDREEEEEEEEEKEARGKGEKERKRRRLQSPIYVLKRTFAYGTPRKGRK
jgi:hypothetical protein